MPKTNGSKYRLAQERIDAGLWRVDAEAGVVLGRGDQPIGRLNSIGYIRLSIIDPATSSTQRRILTVLAHRVIWESVHGRIPDGLTLNHMDGDKANNRLANLEAVTMSENIQHAYDTGLNQRITGERHHAVTLANADAATIYQAVHAGPRGTAARLSEKYGIDARMVSAIKHGHRRHADIDALLDELVGR